MQTVNEAYIFPVETKVQRARREQLLMQRSRLIWFTGLSGSGKSTLATGLEALLYERGFSTYLLDGDNLRAGLNSDLTFTTADRSENIRRVAEVSKLFLDGGFVTLSAFISPRATDRQRVRNTVGWDNYIEVFVDCPLEECERRDVKGLYNKARAGAITQFTGVSAGYERPEQADITIRTDRVTPENAVNLLFEFVLPKITL